MALRALPSHSSNPGSGKDVVGGSPTTSQALPPSLTVKAHDVKDENMLFKASWLAVEVSKQHKVEKDVARAMKEGMDAEFGGPWQ